MNAHEPTAPTAAEQRRRVRAARMVELASAAGLDPGRPLGLALPQDASAPSRPPETAPPHTHRPTTERQPNQRHANHQVDPEPVTTADRSGDHPVDGVVTISAAEFAELRGWAAVPAQIAAEQAQAARERTVLAALHSGKITPYQATHWRTAYDIDPAGSAAALAAIPNGHAIPLEPIGHTRTGDEPLTAEQLALMWPR